MELRDLIVTPIVIFLVYAVAYWIRPRVTDTVNRKYFIPALTVRIIGALAVGFIYQFYYGGGDTFSFHTHGSRLVWEAFIKNPYVGIKLILANGQFESDTFAYASLMPFYQDPSSYFVVRISTLLDLLTFSSYTATAILFALISFWGMWLLFLTFYKSKPHLHFWIAIACFYIPSVFFWGSGLLKDTLTLAALGITIYAVSSIFIHRESFVSSIFLLAIGVITIFAIKKYILLCLTPALFLWIYSSKLGIIRSYALRILILPLAIVAIAASAYWAVLKIGDGDKRYALENIATTAKITAYDIGFYTGKNAGSGYDLGELDGTFFSMLSLMPQAINVTLFRPYLWESKNPFMLISAMESSILLVGTLILIFRKPQIFLKAFSDPGVLFCFAFSLTFAFAVGVSTYNFGTLVRYKIPMIPFYVLGLALIWDYLNSDKKLEVLDVTE